jgi:hypothetical protein
MHELRLSDSFYFDRMTGLEFKPTMLQVECPTCKVGLFGLDDKVIENYVRLRRDSCKCGRPIDLWELVLHSLSQDDTLLRFVAVVAYYFSFPLRGPTGQAWKVPWGVERIFPHGRMIEDRLTVVEGNVRPVEYDDSSKHTAFGLLGNTAKDVYGQVKIEMVFVPYSPDFAQGMLIDALKLFNKGRYVDMVLPANVAVESMLGGVIEKFFDSIVGKSTREGFLNEALTYGYMLSVMLPLCCRWLDYPMPTKDVVDALTLLRKTRNDVAHSGRPKKRYQSTDYARMLTAAIIACRYLFQLDKRVKELADSNAEKLANESKEWNQYLVWKKGM